MKKIFLFLCMAVLLNSQLKAQNTSYDSNAVSIGGTNNVAFGLGALSVTNGQHNVAIGIGALENLGAASSNTAVGFGAMQNSVGVFFNTAVGLGALRNNQANYSTALGWGALANNTGGEFNTGTGGEALANNTNGIYNTANGFRALYSNVTGSNNTATGLQALFFNVTGSYNTANGYQALYNNTGSYNTANGYQALVANTTGEGNTANGYQSFFNNTTGTWGTAIGHGALYSNTTGNNNTATGLLSLFNSTTGNNNTAYGRDALLHNITGDNNSALGFGADVATGTLNNATAIGAQAIVTESNAIQFGNASVAKVFNGVGNNATFITGGLQVTGGIPAVGKVLTSDAAGLATWQIPPAGIGGSGTLNFISKFTPNGVTLGNSQLFDNGTNIGIGTTSPAAKLDITGNIKITDGTQGAGKVLTSDANGVATWQTPATGSSTGWKITGNAGTVDGTNFIGTTDNIPFNIRVNNRPAGRIEGLAGQSTFYGFESGLLNTSSGNTGYGFKALNVNTTGQANTSVGLASMLFNTSGSNNTATGASALLLNTTGNNNTAYGNAALTGSNANNNTAVGFRALAQNRGDENTALGSASLYNNMTGRRNTAIGDSADVVSGNLDNSTALGYHAIVRLSNSIQLGNDAVTYIFAGVGTTATIVTGGLQVTGGSPGVGKVLTSNASGVATWQTPAVPTPSWSLTGNAGTIDGTNFIGTTDNVPFNIRVNNQKAGRIESSVITANTFLGYRSGNVNSGGNNTAVGYTALALNAGSSGNTATGAFALSTNTTGNYNSAFGGDALSSNLSGTFNTATGNAAMLNNVNGGRNTAMGVEALRNNVNGARNTAVGTASMLDNIGGNFNTAIGMFSFANGISGDFNTAVGFNSGFSGTAFNNATAIGNGALATSGNRVTLGNLSVQTVEGAVAYTQISDGRFKTNVSEDDVKGLAFITKLRPVVYNLQTKKLQQFLTRSMPDSIGKRYMDQDFAAATSIRQSGFIAQEVERAAKETKYNFNGVHKPENENDHYSLAYSQFVVPLVKAVQEQQVMIEKLQREVEELKKTPPSDLKVNTETIELSDNNNIVLNQNVPNPFAQQTSISYTLPANSTSAQMLFYGMDGKLMKTANLTTKGKGILNVYANDLGSGSYTYSLVVDGKLIDTKKLVKQ